MHICYAKEATKDAMGTEVPLLPHSLNRVATLLYVQWRDQRRDCRILIDYPTPK